MGTIRLKFGANDDRANIAEGDNMTNGKPVHITDADFDQLIAGNPLVVVDLWAAWCGPCRMIGPVLDQLAGEYAGQITFAKLNIDENQQVPTKFGVMSIPTLLVFKDGKMVERLVGAMPKPMLEQKLKPFL